MVVRKGVFTIPNLLVSILLIMVLSWLAPVFGPIWRDLFSSSSGLNRVGVFLGGLAPLLTVLLYVLYSMETGVGNR